MRLIAAIILYTLFLLLCIFGTGSDQKNIRSFYSYPDKIQILLIKSGKFEIPKKPSYAKSFLSNTLIFTAVFLLIGMIICEDSFWYYLILGEGLNLFDFLVIDLLWWQHSRRVRFKEIGGPKDYLGAEKHALAFVRAIPVFAAAALLAAVILNIMR